LVITPGTAFTSVERVGIVSELWRPSQTAGFLKIFFILF